jgi:sporulation protein YlmC with PRC-barrel domain
MMLQFNSLKEQDMLWNASAMNGYAVAETDGNLGSVKDLLVDDETWTVRWLVVDTGSWLPGRKVLLPPFVLGKPDVELRQFPVELTRAQVKESPDVDTDLPVSRQSEAHLYDYYDWDPYWDGSFSPVSLIMAVPTDVTMNLPYRNPDDLHEGPHSARGNPHLRSIHAITGYDIHAADGKIGHVEDILIDDAGWVVRYLTVDTGNWWPGERVLIAPRSILKIDWVAEVIYLNVDRDTVKKSPAYDPAITVDGAYDEKHFAYYSMYSYPM